MTLDQLIDELMFLKEQYPGSGSLKVFRVTKQKNDKVISSIERKKLKNFREYGFKLDFKDYVDR